MSFSQQAERLFNKGGGRPGILRRATDFAWPEAGIQRGFKVIIKFDVFPPGFSRPTDRDTKYAGGFHADEKTPVNSTARSSSA